MRSEETVLAETKQNVGLSNSAVTNDEHFSQVIITNVPLHFYFYTSNKGNDHHKLIRAINPLSCQAYTQESLSCAGILFVFVADP